MGSGKRGELKEFLWLMAAVALLFGVLFLVSENLQLTGFAVNSYNGQELQKLKLEEACSPEPEVYRVWEVWNKNAIEVEFYWELIGTSQNGTGIAVTEGYAYFNTTAIAGVNRARIFVNGSLHDNQESSGEQCEPEQCIENWSCSDWGECIDGNQTRECADSNFCNTTITIPAILQTCEEEPEPCAENWLCGNWSECANSSQTRICEDANFCNTTLLIPALVQECNETAPGNGTLSGNETTTNATETPAPAAESSGSSSSSGGGGGGGSGGGGSSYTPAVVENKTKTATNGSAITGKVVEASVNQTAATEPVENTNVSRGFFRIVGDVVKVPVDKVKSFLDQKSTRYKITFFLTSLLTIVSVVSLFRYIKLKRKEQGYDSSAIGKGYTNP